MNERGITLEDPPIQQPILVKIITKPVILKDVTLSMVSKCCFLNCGLFTNLEQRYFERISN